MPRTLADAAWDNNLPLFKQLLNSGADVNQREKWTHGTALIWAADNGNHEMVKLLLAHDKTDINAGNRAGVTALMLAAKKGHLHIVDDLLAADGIDINKQSLHGVTALINAAGFGHRDVVLRLLEQPGISLTGSYTDKKLTPQDVARIQQREEIVAILTAFAAKGAAARPSFKPPKI